MTAKEFEAQVKVGDRIVLREDLMNDTVYGGESYILPTPATPWGMVKPGSTVTVSKIMIRGEKEKHPEFFVDDDTEWFYTPEMVDHVVCEEKKSSTIKVEGGMSVQEFLERAKVGDTVILRSDLVDNVKYGDDVYMANGMFKPGSKAVISGINRQVDGKVFVFLKGDRDYWRYTPEMIARVISSDYSEREEVVELWIKKVGLEKARRFIDENLTEGDIIKIADSVAGVSSSTTKFWGCYYWENYMLEAGRTAKIVSITYNGADGRGRRYSLDKERHYCYSVPMFDITYVGSRNEHLFNSIEKDLKTGTYVKKEPVKTESTETGDKVLEYLQKKLVDLKYEVEMVESMIKRLSKDE